MTSPNRAARRAATRGGVVLDPVTLRQGIRGGSTTIRNVATGQVLPCCYAECEKPASTRHEIGIPHEAPRWPGEKLVYAFCSDDHRRSFAVNTRFERYL